MGNQRRNSRIQSTKIAFCGLIVALSVALMLSGGLIPIATYCVPMAVGILLLPILLEFGKKTAWTAYAAIAVLTLIIGIDKEAAFFFIFTGYYPLLKWEIERLKKPSARWAAKLLVFNGSVLLMYLFLGLVMNMDAVIAEFTQMGFFWLALFIVMLNICLVLYDRLLFPLMVIYVRRIQPRLRFLRR